MSASDSDTRLNDVEGPRLDVEKKGSANAAPAAHTSEELKLEGDEHPQNMPASRKWLAIVVISSASFCCTCASSIAGFTEDGVSTELHASKEATILAISLFVEGLGWGPLLVSPLSELYGRTIIYQVSFLLFFAFSFPVAFAPNLACYLVFRFVTGFCGSAFLSVAGGSVSDMFTHDTVGNPMAFYTLSPFLGPVFGPLISGFINQHLNWRWTYRFSIIWIFAEMILLLLFVPESYAPVLLQRKAKRLRKANPECGVYAPLDKREISLAHMILVSCYTPFQILIHERMALLLNTWTSLLLGILYLTFQAFPIIFENNHEFSEQETGLSFLGIGLGMLIALVTQPYWNRVYQRAIDKHGGEPPPEVRLKMGEVGGILVPIGLFWLAFTTYPSVHWVVPIIASIPFGAGTAFVFITVFTYLVSAYRPVAASAMAGNSAMRSAFAAAFPLFAPAMYHRLGTVGATALLAGLSTIMAPLPFIFARIGGRLREQSKFGAR